jgi:hypothetical protein
VRKSLFMPLFAATLVASAGCAKQTDLFPVNGKILYQGTPAVGATVTFVRKETGNRMTEQVPQGVVGEDGTFSLVSLKGAGALPGEYVVLVEWKEGSGKVKGRSPGLNAPDRLGRRYLNPEKPLLTATVEKKSNTLPAFDLN